MRQFKCIAAVVALLSSATVFSQDAEFDILATGPDGQHPVAVATGNSVLVGTLFGDNFELHGDERYEGVDTLRDFFLEMILRTSTVDTPRIGAYAAGNEADIEGLDAVLQVFAAHGSILSYDLNVVGEHDDPDVSPDTLSGYDVIVLDAATAGRGYLPKFGSAEVVDALRGFLEAGGGVVGSAHMFVNWVDYPAWEKELYNHALSDLFGGAKPVHCDYTAVALTPKEESIVTLNGAHPELSGPTDPHFHFFLRIGLPEERQEGPDLIRAFAFGADAFTCQTANDPAVDYTKVAQENLGIEGMKYDPVRGWGYEVTRPGDQGLEGWGVFGPIDDSPNDRDIFNVEDGVCAEELYDQSIGAKQYSNPCTALPCPPVPGTDDPEGIHFRIDIPNGRYRFVAAVGGAAHLHIHSIIVEDGGEGEAIHGSKSVVLVEDFNQAQRPLEDDIGPAPGPGLFARIGFDCNAPPLGDGVSPDPRFVNMDDNGRPTLDPPNSPTLEVTAGYVRLHQVQATLNQGPAGMPDNAGSDMVVFEIWRVAPDLQQFFRGDANADGKADLSDAVRILGWLFLGDPEPPCLDAADTNDSGQVTHSIQDPNLSDAVFLLSWLFLGTAPPPAPGPTQCGTDPTDDVLGCLDYIHCD